MNLSDAVDYIPNNPTYAIRIDSPAFAFCSHFALQDSSLYTIAEYSFDDQTPQWGDGKLFDVEIAQRLLTDFKEEGLDKDTLLVHCSRGQNRSPAVGIALNESFGLGCDTDKLKRKYPEANWFVYDTLIEVVGRLL